MDRNVLPRVVPLPSRRAGTPTASAWTASAARRVLRIAVRLQREVDATRWAALVLIANAPIVLVDRMLLEHNNSSTCTW